MNLILRSVIKLESSLFEIESSLIVLKKSLIQIESSLIQLPYLLTYSSSLLGEHRASTIILHLSRSCAARLASPQDIRIDLNSASNGLLHVVTGRPLLLLPWGFQSSACFVMLLCGLRRMCPIQRHFRAFMVWTMGVWLVLLQSSMLVILSGHLMFKICRRHLLTKTWISFSVFFVCFQVSDSKRRTDLTLLSKILSLVFRLMFLFRQTGLKMTNACLAFPILTRMSSSVPPELITMLPRYVKWSTSSMFLSFNVIGPLVEYWCVDS